LRETKTQGAEYAYQGSKVCNKIESFIADFHQRCMCDEILPQPSGKQQRIQQRACWAMNQKRQGSFASKRKTTKSHFNSVFVLEGHGHGGGAYVFVHQRE